MNQIEIPDPPQTKHADFFVGYLWAALGLALLVGFNLGAHVAFILGFGYPLSKGFASFVQIHGHVQLVGFAGLFIMGVSLHFAPRATGAPIAHPQSAGAVLWLVSTGLILRSVAHSALPYLGDHSLFIPFSWIVVASGIIEWLGVLLYLRLLFHTVSQSGGPKARPGLWTIVPFLGMMAAGWLVYASMNALLLLQMALGKTVVLDQAWNDFAIEVFTGLVLLPVAFAFSVRTFPLYLRLPSVDWPVARVAGAYLFCFCLQVVPALPCFQGLTASALLPLSVIGRISKAGVIVWFVWKLDVLTRRREPWIVNRVLHPTPERRPTRPGLPDYGEFGRFEWLVYAAYAWLVLGALLDIADGTAFLLGLPFAVARDATRHCYLLGFVTLLIFGMAPRMISGFLRKKRTALPWLVAATFWLGNLAMVSRILLMLFPPAVLNALPHATHIAQAGFAYSGILGMIAILCLTINLMLTARRR